jgi:hypothetical protein
MMNITPHRAHHDDLPSIRAAQIALGWVVVVVFLGFHVYWCRLRGFVPVKSGYLAPGAAAGPAT